MLSSGRCAGVHSGSAGKIRCGSLNGGTINGGGENAASRGAHLLNRISGRNAHHDSVFSSIVCKKNEVAFLRNAIEGYAQLSEFLVVSCFQSSNRDVVVGFAISVAQRELVPLLRQAWRETKAIHFQIEPQQRLDDKTVHPARRARVPGPAATARVRCERIYIGGDDVGFHLVRRGTLRRSCVID